MWKPEVNEVGKTIIAELEKVKTGKRRFFKKAYRHVTDIKAAIDEIGDYSSCVGVKSCGRPNEQIVWDEE